MVERYLCKECMQNEYETQMDNDPDFPVFTIVGGMLGTAATIFSASLVLIPIGLLFGIGADIVRCEVCGSDEDIYQVMTSGVDEYERVYSPLDSEEGGDDDQDYFWNIESESSPKTKYRYDNGEKKFMPIEESSTFRNSESNQSEFDWSISSKSAGNTGPDVADNGSHNSGDSVSSTGNSQTGLNPDMGGLAGSGAGSANMSFSSGGG